MIYNEHMNDKGYISKLKKGTSLYETLHEEALEILQKLSGGVWTDYNEHDPGVTLLENIAYAITEIAHKIKLPIEDLLQSSKGNALASGDNGFFTASDILTTNPVTFNDYRKLWIDQISNVKNVWVSPVSDYHTDLDTVKGLLHIFVQKYEYQTNPNQEQIENNRIRKDIQTLYNSNRNLCESLYAIEISQSLTFTIDFKIRLLDLVDSEEVLAAILYRINAYLAPEVGYYALRQLQQEHCPTNTIFNGPLLSNGFIKDEDLQAPLDVIEISEIIKRISKIPGVVSINDFQLHYKDRATHTLHTVREQFRMPKNTTASVLFPETNDGLIFENSGVSFKPDLKATKKQLAFIQALDDSKFKAASNSLNSIPIPEGKLQDIDYHYPIRKQLPELYGVGERGISAKASALRQAQVKQLQGYLLPFDQIIINFLAQLSHIYTLYDVANNTDRSYFTNPLPDAKALLDLLAPPTEPQLDNDAAIIAYWTKLTYDLNVFFDYNAPDRLNKVADHLLARHGETFKTFALYKINSSSYGSAIDSPTFKKTSLTAKQELIKHYANISYHRSTSFNIQSTALLPKNPEQQATPGLLKKIALLMGISNFEIKSLTQSIATSGIQIHPETIEIDLVVETVSPLETIVVETPVIKEETKENLALYMHFVGDKDHILEQVLREGIRADSYTVTQNKAKEALFYVLHQSGNNTSHIAHSTTTKEAAHKAIQKTIQYLVNLSQNSEGFFMLEHVLLLPPYSGNHFGFDIILSSLDPKIDITLTQVETTAFAERNATIAQLHQGLIDQTILLETQKTSAGYVLTLSHTEGTVLAVSKHAKASKTELEAQRRQLQNEDFTRAKTALEAATVCQVYYKEHAVEERFFSFRLSFIMPSWPVRFQNPNFRSSFENTCYENVPIHIYSSTHWLPYQQMLDFENHYFKWLAILQEDPTSEAFLYNAYELIQQLQQFGSKY